jgi:hypothetical protein
MHLSDEKKWIYGSLVLTVAFFLILIFLPLFTITDSIGAPVHVPSAVGQGAAGEHEGH